jgi:AraC-like DNA-binding protein
MIQFHRGVVDEAYLEFEPAQHLNRYIYCYWVSPAIVEGSLVERLVPDGCTDLLFGMDKAGNSCRNIIVGTMSEGATVNMDNDSIQTFGVRFYPGGLQAFIRESADKFTDKMEYIETLEQKILVELQQFLSRIPSIPEKIAFVNQYFTLKQRSNIQWENDFQNIVYCIYKSNGNIRLSEIARKEAISEKQITRIVHNRVGLSTKELINIIRMQNVLRIINANRRGKIIDIALETGYYDQAHFTKDFIKFCDMSPAKYLEKLKNRR